MLEPEPEEVGLCFTCRHARRVPAATTLYWLCRLSASDPAFERYPRLPVRRCAGYRRADAGAGEEAGGR
jgi:hypothetical protein